MRFVFRTLRKVAVFEVVGEDRVMDCDNDAQAHIEAVKMANEEFPGKIDVTVEIKKLEESGAGQQAEPAPRRKETDYGMPF